MSRKTCKRKVWATKGFDAIAHAISGARVTDQATLDELLTRELSSIESLTHGHGTLQDWWDLSAVVNLCETAAAKMGIGPEAMPACAKAQEALLQAAKRFESTRCMGLDGQGIAALRDVIEYHQLQRQSIPRSQYEQLLKTTMQRIKSKAPEVVEV